MNKRRGLTYLASLVLLLGLLLLSLNQARLATAEETEAEASSGCETTSPDLDSNVEDSSAASSISRCVPLPVKCALIIVSNLTCIDQNEMAKAISLYDHLILDGWDEEKIDLFCPDTSPSSEGLANLSNVKSGFQALIDEPHANKDVLIYISDHGFSNGSCYNLSFTDGNLSSETITGWLDEISYSHLTFTMTGNHSGLAGPEFVDVARDIICSMGSLDEFSPDQFNITRGLTDSQADTDHNGRVSFVEAYYSERAWLLMNTNQVPQLWQL